MSKEGSVKGVFLAHGAMAQGVVDAIQKISGVEEGALIGMSNEGRSPDTLQAELDELLDDAPAIVFTDLAHGSCAVTARLCCRGTGRRAVVFGVNLPLLLDFVFNRHLPLDQLVPRLLEKGRDSLRSAPEFSDHGDPASSS